MPSGFPLFDLLPAQSDFRQLLALYIPVFLLYIGLISSKWSPGSIRRLLWFSLLLRVLMALTLPGLSDDVYRFIWDGRLIVSGLNPFDHPPAYYMEPGHGVAGLTADLYARLNSPRYFTVYPPLAQASFALGAFLFPREEAGSILVMKAFLLACEAGTILWLLPGLLRRLGLPGRRALIYALNPLIILEVTGNLHYEGAMIFFLLLGLRWLLLGKRNLPALAFALSIASKLLPLMFLPFLIRRLGREGSLRYFAVLGVALALLFLPLLNGVFAAHLGSSLDLYFRKFEFNASVFYLLRWVGLQLSGYNLIRFLGPGLALLVLTGIARRAWNEQGRNMERLPPLWLFSITLYLLLATTVHPWYLSLPVALCLFTPYRFPVLWSGLIMLTYINYSYEPYRENLWVVTVEYLCLALFLLWEVIRKDSRRAIGQLPVFSLRHQT